MIPLDVRCAVMKKMEGESFEGVEAEYVGNATVDVAGATFRLTEYGTLWIKADRTSTYGFYPDFQDLDETRKKFRVAVARTLGVDYRQR